MDGVSWAQLGTTLLAACLFAFLMQKFVRPPIWDDEDDDIR